MDAGRTAVDWAGARPQAHNTMAADNNHRPGTDRYCISLVSELGGHPGGGSRHLDDFDDGAERDLVAVLPPFLRRAENFDIDAIHAEMLSQPGTLQRRNP